MDRGFGSSRGGYNPSRQVSDRRYDDFYSDGRRGGRMSGGGGGGRRDWDNGNKDMGIFNQAQRGPRPSAPGNVGNQILAAALQQHQQHSLLKAFMTSQQPTKGILPSPPSLLNNMMQGGAARRNDNRYNSYGNSYNGRPGEKRKTDQRPSGFQNKRRPPPSSKSSDSRKGSSQEKKSQPPPPPKEEEIDIPDDEVIVPDSLKENVEKLRQRKEIQRNVADEDVKKLVTFCFTGKGYLCLTCGLFLTKESAFVSHLDGKTHVMNVIDARTAKKYQEVRDILDIDLTDDDWYEKSEKAKKIILKQAKMIMKTQREIKQREIENYNKNPANFFTVTMETRKAAVKKGNTVTIKSIVETSMEVKDFGSDRHFGCEFIKAVSGFNCRLCGLHINDSDGVIPHVESRLHKTNYQNHLRKTSGYEKVQTEQNKELRDALAEHEDRFVLLSESVKAGEQTFLASMEEHLVRVPELFKADPSEKDETKEEETNEDDTPTKVENGKVDAKNATKETESDNKEEKKEKSSSNEVKEEPVEETTDAKPTETKENKTEQTVVKEEATEDVVTEEAEQAMETDPAAVATEETEKTTEAPAAEVKKEESPKPKKSILKKTPVRSARGASTATKRGRGRGKATPSPRSARAKKAATSKVAEEVATEEPEGVSEETPKEGTPPQEEAPDQEMQEEPNDGNFMEGFEVVDEA